MVCLREQQLSQLEALPSVLTEKKKNGVIDEQKCVAKQTDALLFTG